MIGSLSTIDILFLVTIILLVFNGLRNGFVFSLVNLLSIPIAFAIAWVFGPQLTQTLAANNLNWTPLVSYVVLFFGAVLVLHILGTVLRGIIRKVPFVGLGDSLLGAVIGFVEAWLLWVVLLLVLHNFLLNIHSIPGVNAAQFRNWQDFYDNAISGSLFAKVNSFMISRIHQ